MLLVFGGLAAAAIVAGIVIFALDRIPQGDETTRSGSVLSETQPKGEGDDEHAEFKEFDPRLLPVQPLSKFKENKYWKKFFDSPEKVVQLVNYDIDLRVLTDGGGDWISPQKPDLDRYAFQMGLAFVQQYGREAPKKDDVFDDSVLVNRRREERFREWFERLDLGEVDEFQRRDLEKMERAAIEEIMARIKKGTSYTVISDWPCRFEEYDFDRRAFPLVSTPYPEIDFGELEIRRMEFKAIHVSEKDARKLRDEGVTHICIRRTFRLEWGGRWFHQMIDPDIVSVTISPLESGSLPSPKDWALSIQGEDTLLLHRADEVYAPSKETYDAFSQMLRDYHLSYMDQSVAHYKPFSVLMKLNRTDADSYLGIITRLQAERDYRRLLELSDEWEEVASQFRLLQATQELNRLFESYSGGIWSGLFFMKAENPSSALKSLEGWLNSHGQMNETHDAILTEVEKLKNR